MHVWMQKRIMEIDIDVVYDINTKNLWCMHMQRCLSLFY
jgi:hypothetical protein